MMTTPRKKQKDAIIEKGQHVQVFVRGRPLSAQEKTSKCYSAVEIKGERDVVVKNSPNHMYNKGYQFDRAFGPTSTQNEVYNAVVNPLIGQVLQGYNCTVFAYGQTGTGKTYTMEGFDIKQNKIKSWDNENLGIIPQAVCQIFDDLRGNLDTEFSVKISFLELYNEEIFDLLSPADDTSKLRLYEDAARKGSVILHNLEEVQVRNKAEIYHLLEKGALKRKTAETLMNANSSRSHTVFTVTIHIKEPSIEGEEVMRVGKLNLVDLAGSENVARSGVSGGRAREAGSINQSLLTLGRVISCLVERTPHVPYRESKLTRLLQDSLGGKTKTSIIATFSPANSNVEETISTLDYAQRARNITCRPEVNQKLSKMAVFKEYNDEIERLRQSLVRTREGEGVYLAQENYQQMLTQIEEQEREIKEAIGEMRALKQEMDNKVEQFELCQKQLQESKAVLDVEKERLGALEGKLSGAREELQETAKNRDIQVHLVKKHQETETTLGQQARKLQVYCDEATSDEVALQDKLDRARVVETENRTLQEAFVATFQERVKGLTASLKQYQEEQHERLSTGLKAKVSSSLSQNNLKLSSFLATLSSLKQCSNSTIKEIESMTEENSAQMSQSSTRYHEKTVATLSQLSAASISFKDEAMATFLADMHIQLTREQEVLAAIASLVEKSDSELTAQFLEAAASLSNQVLELEAELAEAVDSDASDMTKMVESNARANSSLETMKSALDTMMSAHAAHFQVIEEAGAEHTRLSQNMRARNVAKKEDVQTTHNRLIDDKTKAVAGVKEGVNRSSGAIRESLARCGEINTSQSKIRQAFKEKQAAFAAETSRRMADGVVKQTSVFVDEAKEKSREFASALISANLKHLTDLQVDKDNLDSGIESFNEMSSTMLKEQKQELTGLSSNCAAAIGNSDAELKELQSQVENFVLRELKQNVATGKTPKPVERSYPRVLSATSPHGKIVERYMSDYTLPDLKLDVETDDSVFSKSTASGDSNRTSDAFSSQIGASSLSGSRAGSLTDLVSDQENDGSAAKVRKGLNPLADDKENLAASNPVFKVPATGLKKPEIFFAKNAAKS